MILIILLLIVLEFLLLLGCQDMLRRNEKDLSYIKYLLNKKGGEG